CSARCWCAGAPYPRDCPGEFDLFLDRFARLNPMREPRTVSIFELGLVLSRTSRWAFLYATLTSDRRSHDGRAAAITLARAKEAMMATGTVKGFDPTEGYGFVQPQDDGRDVLV